MKDKQADLISAREIWERIEELKRELGWQEASVAARRWWVAYERENLHQPFVVMRLLEELCARTVRLNTFQLACSYSDSGDVNQVLRYYDFVRARLPGCRELTHYDFERVPGGMLVREDSPYDRAIPQMSLTLWACECSDQVRPKLEREFSQLADIELKDVIRAHEQKVGLSEASFDRAVQWIDFRDGVRARERAYRLLVIDILRTMKHLAISIEEVGYAFEASELNSFRKIFDLIQGLRRLHGKEVLRREDYEGQGRALQGVVLGVH